MNDAVPSPDVPVRVVTERPKDVPRLVFTRGKAFPKAIAWFGFRSFWGHLWHLSASVIATEDIDARAWMTVTPAADFTALLAGRLGGDETDGAPSRTASSHSTPRR